MSNSFETPSSPNVLGEGTTEEASEEEISEEEISEEEVSAEKVSEEKSHEEDLADRLGLTKWSELQEDRERTPRVILAQIEDYCVNALLQERRQFAVEDVLRLLGRSPEQILRDASSSAEEVDLPGLQVGPGGKKLRLAPKGSMM